MAEHIAVHGTEILDMCLFLALSFFIVKLMWAAYSTVYERWWTEIVIVGSISTVSVLLRAFYFFRIVFLDIPVGQDAVWLNNIPLALHLTSACVIKNRFSLVLWGNASLQKRFQKMDKKYNDGT